MACQLSMRNDKNVSVYRSNGYGPLGHFKWDSTWEVYRFYPNKDYSLSKGDLEDLLYLLKKLGGIYEGC